MNSHVKIGKNVKPADLSRRSFLVGSAAAGLALGYSAVPGLLGADQALAAAGNFDPSVWYSIAPDGIVTVTCGKADMGQHIASTMAQIVSEELGSNWKDMRVQLASNDPKFNDPVLGRADHRRQLVDDDELRRDEPRRRRRAYRVDGSRSRHRWAFPPSELVVRNSTDLASEVEEVDELCRHRQERQNHQDLHAGRAEGDQAEDRRSIHHDRRLGAAARHPRRRPTARPNTASTSCCRAWSTARWSRRRCASAPR